MSTTGNWAELRAEVAKTCRADFLPDEGEKLRKYFCVFQDFETKSGRKYADKMCATIKSVFP